MSSFLGAQDWMELSDPIYGNYNGLYGNAFGRAVSLNSEGNRVAIGDQSSSKDEPSDGRAVIFERRDSNWYQLGEEIIGKEYNSFLGGALALNGEGNILITTSNALKGEFSIYELLNNEWIQKGNVLPTLHGNATNISVSINQVGDCVAVLGKEPGFPIIFSVLVYFWNPLINDWTQKGDKFDMQERQTGQYTNGTIELSADGNAIIIGNPIFQDENLNSNSPEGRVDVFYWEDEQWKQKGEAFIGESGEKLGHNVNISADANTILMGAPLNDNYGQNTGEVRLFHWIDSSWQQKGEAFTTIDSTWNAHFASSMNADGNKFALWSHEATEGGGVQVFSWENNSWVQVGTNILAALSGDGPRNNFISLSDSGCKVAVGSPYDTLSQGRVNVFELGITKELDLCDGDTIYINGTAYYQDGRYIDTLHSVIGCDTTLFLDINVDSGKTSFLTFETCENHTVEYNGQELNPGFNGEFNYPIAGSCDSIVFVEVIELHNDTIEVNEFICKDSFFLHNEEFVNGGSIIEINLKSSLGCDSIVLLHVEEYDYGTDFLPDNIHTCNQEYVLSSPFSNTTWSNGTIGKTIEISESSIFSASYLNEFGCNVVDTVEVKFDKTAFYVPNAFDPNWINGNDCFRVLFPVATKVEKFQLMIFDRWGNLMWETKDSEDCWNGTFNNGSLEQGVYVWRLEFEESNCGIIQRQYGDVTLIK